MERNKKKALSLKELALISLYIGLTGYGGPAILGYMKKVFVDEKKYVDEPTFMMGLSLSQMLPGATNLEMIEFLGYQLLRVRGAVVATICFAIPPFILMTILSAVYFTFGKLAIIQSLFTGLGAVVVALLINATVILGRSSFKDFRAMIIASLAFLGVQYLHLHILLVIGLTAAAGLVIYNKRIILDSPNIDIYVQKRSFSPKQRWLVWVGGALCIAIVIVLEFFQNALPVKLISSMLRIGVTAFGGGFTSIPLFQHETIALHHWLTPRQFLDGIALGQITPGPVLITATFIGYRLLGVPGAVLATVSIFAPSGLAVLLTASQFERFVNASWARAAIKGILAGFIGILLTVILRLGAASLTDWKTVGLFLASILIIFGLKKDPIWVILGGAIISPFLFM